MAPPPAMRLTPRGNVGTPTGEPEGMWNHWIVISRTPLLWGLFVVLFVEIFGASLMLPIFQYFCTHELHMTATQVGTMFSIFNVARIFSAPMLGRCSDAFGRRLLLLGCFFASSICFSLIALVQTYHQLLIVQFFFGMAASGNFPLSQAIVGDVSAPASRASVLSIMMAVINVSMTLSPVCIVLIAFYEVLNRRVVFVAAAILCFLGCVLGLFIIRESLPYAKRRPLFGGGSGEERRGCICNGTCRGIGGGILLIWLGGFFVSVVYMSLITTYALFIYHAFGFTDLVFGLILCGCGISGALVQIFIFPIFDRWLGRHLIAVTASLMAGVGLILLPNTGSGLWLHLTGMFIVMAGLALLDPIMPDLVIAYAPSQKHIGMAQGIANGFKACACCIAPLLAGSLYDIEPHLPFYVAAGACCCVVCCVLLAGFIGSAASEEEQDALLGSEVGSKLYTSRSKEGTLTMPSPVPKQRDAV